MVNDKIEKLLFFRDVTFGILYESMKASENLQNLINDTINTRIGIPLNTLVRTVARIEDPEKLLKIE